jgi:hypothetical protein
MQISKYNVKPIKTKMTGLTVEVTGFGNPIPVLRLGSSSDANPKKIIKRVKAMGFNLVKFENTITITNHIKGVMTIINI